MLLTITLHKLRRFSRLERRLRLEALAWLGLVCVLIPLFRLQRIARLLGLNLAPSSSQADDTEIPAVQMEMAAQIGRAIQSAAAKTPWQSACLAQALTGAAMLRRRHMPGALYLGVARENSLSEGMAAHAWLRCGTAVVTGGIFARYVVVGRYTW